MTQTIPAEADAAALDDAHASARENSAAAPAETSPSRTDGSTPPTPVSFAQLWQRLLGATHVHAPLAGVLAAIITYITAWGRVPVYNNYDLLADAFLHGRIWINFPGDYIDALPYNGQHYIIEGPLLGVLQMPFVAISGPDVSQLYLSAILTGLAISAAWTVCQRLGLNTVRTAALVLFLFAGTDLLWLGMLGDVWNIAEVSGVTFTMLALAELFGQRRGWLVGLWSVCAFESRFSMALVIPVYLYLLLSDADHPRRLAPGWQRRLIEISAVGAVALILYVAYNHARWGTLGDSGYTRWYRLDQVGTPDGTPFQLRYLQHQLYSFFIQGPTFHPGAPWITPDMTGQALEWTSPALVLVFLARRPTRLVVAMWVATAAGAATNLVYYVNGFNQFGMRHATDFEPFLFVLMALAVRQRFPRWGYVLVGFSAVVGVWGCWYWQHYYV